MKNPLTPDGIEPATFRFVAQHLNHCPLHILGVCLYSLSLLSGMQIAWFLRYIILSSVKCLVVHTSYIPTKSHKRQEFRRKNIEHKMHVLILSTTSVSNTSHSKKSFSETL